MKFFEKRQNRKNIAKGRAKRRLNEKIRFCERAYGEKLCFESEEELTLWLVTKDPYLGELFL